MSPGQINKTRRKTGKRRLPRLAGMALDHLRHADAQQLGHIRQIRAAVIDGDFHWSLRLPRGRG